MLHELPTFSFFKAPITNNKPHESLNLLNLYKAITEEKYKDATLKYRSIKEAKEAQSFKSNNFDYATISGTFLKRCDNDIITPSGYMVLDIDKQENVDIIKQRLKEDVKLQPLLVFISPGGNGLKVVIDFDIGFFFHNSTAVKKLLPVWQAANNYLAANFSDIIKPDSRGNYIDPSGSDLSRACFICHDEKCFINNKFL